MKKIIALTLVLAMAMSFAACSSQNGGSSSEQGNSSSAAPESASSTSQAPVEVDTKTILDEIYKDLEIMGVTDIDTAMMTDMIGIAPELYDSYGARVGMGRFGIGDVFLVKPTEGNAEQVKQALESYRKSKEDLFENYNVGGDYEKAKNAELYEQGGYVILIMLENNAPAKEIINNHIPA